ncbi:flagellar C1a complex subunit C1a-32-domain-containing protein [Phlyctochytrium arcticum]|nr:flagellar C1a complex subunit C1a-32-domain-containing protein [Phlyctochytrium arcticum]
MVRKHLSMNQVYDFYSLGSSEESVRFLASTLEVNDDAPRTAILLDFFYYTLRFAKDHHFSPEQASAFFSIMKATHDKTVSSPFFNMDQDYSFFKDTLLHHAVHRPPYSQKIFSLGEVKTITEYAVNTYFRHYLMYKYAFTKKLRLDVTFDNFANETPAAAKPAEDEVGPAKDVSTEAISLGDNHPVGGAAATSNGQPQDGSNQKVTENGKSTDAGKDEANASVGHALSVAAESVVKETDTPESHSEPPPAHRMTPQEIASQELSAFVSNLLASKIDDLRKTLLTKLQGQEDQINTKMKKLEDKDDERDRTAKGKDGKGKKK